MMMMMMMKGRRVAGLQIDDKYYYQTDFGWMKMQMYMKIQIQMMVGRKMVVCVAVVVDKVVAVAFAVAAVYYHLAFDRKQFDSLQCDIFPSQSRQIDQLRKERMLCFFSSASSLEGKVKRKKERKEGRKDEEDDEG